MSDYDVIVIGGAAMGAATAFYLTLLDESVDVAVIERDTTYARSSTVLSEGNVRVQFNLEENIRISQYAFEVLATFADDMTVGEMRPEVSARHQGNLFLSDAAGQDAAMAGLATQQHLGCDVEWLAAAEIHARWPAYGAEGVVGGTFGSRDGSVDPNAVIRGYRVRSIAQGAEWVDAEVGSVLVSSGRVSGVRLTDGELVTAPVVVNCAGAWSPALARTVGVDLPVEPVMRNVFVVETMVPTRGLPSVVLPSSLYLIPKHDATFSIAWSQPDDPVGFDFHVNRSSFDRLIWPELVGRMPAFEALHVSSGWAGLYAVNTLDGNAILGEWPTVPGFHICTGFSGHGFQQCHAVGRYLTERILDMEPQLNLSRLGPERVISGTPLQEHPGRII